MDPRPDLPGQLVPVLDQAQVVVRLDQALERSRAFLADRRLRAAAHRLGLKPAFGSGRLDPAVHGRAADREAPGDLVPRLAALQRRRDHAAAQIACVGSGHGAPPARSLQHAVPTSSRFALAGKPAKLALTACVRKLVVTLNAMLRTGTAWQQA
jgi:hypothetical protein